MGHDLAPSTDPHFLVPFQVVLLDRLVIQKPKMDKRVFDTYEAHGFLKTSLFA